jgi:tripartite-type tricarboxylate transporter receptor subunit TctC
MKKITCIAILIALTATSVFANGTSEATPYPNKDINVYIHSSQGGGTDTWARFFGPIMEEYLGVNMVMTSMPGANGGTAAQKVWNSDHDGYSIVGSSDTSMFYGANGVAPSAESWHFFISGGSSGIIVVPANSPYNTIEDLVAAAKANPKAIKISNSGRGKGWHTKAILLEEGAGVEFKHVPYNGSGPAITAMLSGEVDALSCSTGEVSEYVRGGLVKPLVITEAEGLSLEGWNGMIPSSAELFPDTAFEISNMFQWLGFAMPIDTPQEAIDAFTVAYNKALKDPRVIDFVEKQQARIIGLSGAKADQMALNMEKVSWWIANDLGLAKVNPETKGIERP